MKPTEAGIHPGTGPLSAIEIAGAKSDQKLAAIITPPAKPSMPSINFWLTFLVVNTKAAPKAVIPQVNNDASSACTNGLNELKKSIRKCSKKQKRRPNYRVCCSVTSA